jgi:hypothetical protein
MIIGTSNKGVIAFFLFVLVATPVEGRYRHPSFEAAIAAPSVYLQEKTSSQVSPGFPPFLGRPALRFRMNQ